ncbi:MAG: zinc-ribbon domain-containing protein [Gemmatimonadales bacterium]|nr:zinc-ribbon domain-containing protein [Gemmatimonadales bacterium]
MNVTCPNCATIYRVDPAKVPAAGVRARCAVCNAVFPVRREEQAAPPAPPERPDPVPAAPPRAEPSRRELPASEQMAQPALSEPSPSEPVRAAEPAPAPPSLPPAPVPVSPAGTPSRPAAPQRPANPFSRPAAGAPAGGGAAPFSAPAAPAAPVSAPSAPAAPPKPVAPAASPPSVPAPSKPAAPPAAAPAGRPANPFLSQDPSLKARRLARALISDMVVYHPGKRQDGLRDGNLKQLFEDEIKKSWEEYADQVGREVAESTAYFREALNEILAGGRQIF